MSNVAQEILAANQRYAADFDDQARLAMPPARHFAILTCMDARLDPAKFAGLAEGDAHVIGNAGALARMPLVTQDTAFRGEFLPGEVEFVPASRIERCLSTAHSVCQASCWGRCCLLGFSPPKTPPPTSS